MGTMIGRISKAVVSGCALVLLGVPGISSAEEILEFVSDIAITKASHIQVQESILYDFGEDERHGIFRVIPIRYRTSLGSYTGDIKDIYVTDGQNRERPFTVSREGNSIRIKIGDPNVTISGSHRYNISYTVENVLSYYDSFDELYWNVTGNDWATPIREVRGQVRFIDFKPELLQNTCYRGPRESRARCDAARISEATTTIEYAYGEAALDSHEGVTIALAFEKGFVDEPTQSERIWKFIRDNGIVVLPLIVFGFMHMHWNNRGRDPRGRGAIVRQFDPPVGMTPLEMGTLYDQTVHPKDITAELMYLAVHGYLRVYQVEKKLLIFTSTDYVLEKLQSQSDLPNVYDRKLMSAFFPEKHIKVHDVDGVEVEGVALSDLKHELQKDVKEIKNAAYEQMVTKNYFPKKPSSVRNMYLGIGIAVTIGLLILTAAIPLFNSPVGFISALIGGVIVIIYSFFMPARTATGVQGQEHILGLREYLSIAEKDRLEYHNDPERTPERFDKLLPFAMVLGVEKEWAALFEDVYREDEPGWYSSPPGHAFNPAMLATNISSGLNSAVSTASVPQSSGSSGGGSSGGGFGGGGGGSW